jgi:hypothetical protein
MEAELQTHVAFHLTGKRPGAALDAVDPHELRPALFARYRDLTKLRYDYPLVLASGDDPVQALSAICDRVIATVAQGNDAERTTKQVLAIEQQVRALVSEGARGTLAALWDIAAARLGADADEPLRATAARARAALDADGDVVDCDGSTPARVVTHLFRASQARKAQRFAATAGRLIQQLSDLLRADFVRSDAGRSAQNLRAAVGSLHADSFDFDRMSSLLAGAVPSPGMPASRRERLAGLVATLAGQRFHPDASVPNTGWTFEFERCDAGLAAYRERLPQAKALARALAMAELEVAGEYNEARHDPFFDAFGDDGLDPADVALFPDYLVSLNARALDGVENATLTQILSAGLPFKIVITSDDVLDASAAGDGHIGFGRLSRPLATMALGMNEVFVLQAPVSHLQRVRERLARGVAYPGASLFRVFSGANPNFGTLPPYLVSAAALESRAFPAWSYDPSAGGDWAARFDISTNPQVERDWPVTRFTYEDADHQVVTEELAFTLVDFAACDKRYARHFARVQRSQWSARTIPAVDCLGNEPRPPERVPAVFLVDGGGALAKAIVDDKLIREARRARGMWHSLQELAGIHNSHAQRMVALERAKSEAREAQARAAATAAAAAAEPVQAPATAPVSAASAAPASGAAAAPATDVPSDDPYIETTRCTTCNECTTINNQMFAYNENQQAYIKNPDAGTYAELVEAAESCQMGIIHPGKPRNADEPGLDELTARAEAFR